MRKTKGNYSDDNKRYSSQSLSSLQFCLYSQHLERGLQPLKVLEGVFEWLNISCKNDGLLL